MNKAADDWRMLADAELGNVPDGDYVALWDAVNEYATACGGDTSNKTAHGNSRRMNAVCRLDDCVEKLLSRRGRSQSSAGKRVGLLLQQIIRLKEAAAPLVAMLRTHDAAESMVRLMNEDVP